MPRRKGVPRARGPARAAHLWSFDADGRGTVRALERSDRPGVVLLQWHEPGSGKLRRQQLTTALRDQRLQLIPAEVLAAQDAARAFLTQLAEAAHGNHLLDPALTLADALRLAQTPGAGRFAAASEHQREAARHATDIVHVLQGNMRVADVTRHHFRLLWRGIAERVRDGVRRESGRPFGGVRMAEQCVDVLWQTLIWLEDVGALPATPSPPSRWRAKLRDEWQDITKIPLAETHRPRHSSEELRRIYANLHRTDPRLRLALELGLEARLGQVLVARRSQLDLDERGAFGLGRFRIRGRGKKPGTTIDLTASQRRAVDAALSGYLRRCELARHQGVIADYPLFVRGKVCADGSVRVNSMPVTDDFMRDVFHELEQLAGVERVHGRGWYGLRRVASDLAQDVETDTRVLNSVSSHVEPGTRGRVYQERERLAILKGAGLVRERIRGRSEHP